MTRTPSLLLRMLQLAVLPWLGAAFSSGAGDCAGPAGGHGAGGASTAAITAPSTAQPGTLVDVTLSHGTDFKGFLLKADRGATASQGYPSGTKRFNCGGFTFAATHTLTPEYKNDLTFSVQMPCSPGVVTITGSLLFSGSSWSPIDSATITVGGASTCTCAGFDCSGDTNDLATDPDTISCDDNGCAASECCAVARPPPPPPPPPPPADAKTKQLAPDVLMSWVVDGDSAMIDVTYTGEGWIAFGRAEQAGAMIGGEALIGLPGSGSEVAWYSMASYEPSDVTPTGAPVPTGCSIEQTDGQTVLTVSWPTGSGGQELLWAVGSSNALSGGHDLSLHRRSGMSMDFATGETKSSVNHKKRIAMIIHGALMLLGWGILLPFGILASIFRSRIAGGVGGTWLKYHARLQVAGAPPSSLSCCRLAR